MSRRSTNDSTTSTTSNNSININININDGDSIYPPDYVEPPSYFASLGMVPRLSRPTRYACLAVSGNDRLRLIGFPDEDISNVVDVVDNVLSTKWEIQARTCPRRRVFEWKLKGRPCEYFACSSNPTTSSGGRA
jgi:hypothetical protein